MDTPTFKHPTFKHGHAGLPMEVMGLMPGKFIDEYIVQVINMFTMLQSGTTVTVESVDHIFQMSSPYLVPIPHPNLYTL
jgi:hypothetical protein